MITAVHEDDLTAWYEISEPVSDISICDFEFERGDPLLAEDLPLIPDDTDDSFQIFGG